MPKVAVCARPKGLPTAKAKSPTRTLRESPSGTVGRFWPSTRRTAMSVLGSLPTTRARSSLRSAKEMTISVASLMT